MAKNIFDKARQLAAQLKGTVQNTFRPPVHSPIPQYNTQPTYNRTLNQARINVMKPFARVQNFIERPQPVQIPQRVAPQFKNPIVNTLSQVRTGGENIVRGIADSIVNKGIVNPSLDMINMAGRTLGGRSNPGYNNLKSAQARLGYNVMGYNRTPQQVIGNIAGTASPVVDAYGGGKVFGLGKQAVNQVAQQTFKQIIASGAKTGAKYGFAGGLTTGLDQARNAENLFRQLQQGLTSGVIGGAVGGVAGGALAVGGALVGKAINKLSTTFKAKYPNATPQQTQQAVSKFVRDELGRFAKGSSKKAQTDPVFYGDFRKSLGLPENGDYRGGFFVGESALEWPGSKPKGQFSALADKKPRFEIDDSGAKLTKAASERNFYYPDVKKGTLDEYIEHPKLFEQYPDLKNAKVSFVKTSDVMGDGSRAAYNPKANHITVNTDWINKAKNEEVKSTLLHEIQHAIQEKEGFARGGSPNTFKDWDFETIDKADKLIKSRGIKPGTPEYSKEMDKYISQVTPHGQYQRLSGEIEARDVQSRMNLSPDQRRHTQPYASQNIPLKDQITRFDSGVSAFTNTKEYKNNIENALQSAKSAEEGAQIVRQQVDKIVNSAKSENDIKAVRASLNQFINESIGSSGEWKRDYYIKNAEVFGNPENLHLKEAADQIDRIDDILSKGFKTTRGKGGSLRPDHTPKPYKNVAIATNSNDPIVMSRFEAANKRTQDMREWIKNNSNGFIDPSGKYIDVDAHAQAAYKELKNPAVKNKDEALTELMMRGTDLSRGGWIRSVIKPKEVNFEMIGTPSKNQIGAMLESSKGKTIYLDVTDRTGKTLSSHQFKTPQELSQFLSKSQKLSFFTPEQQAAKAKLPNIMYEGVDQSVKGKEKLLPWETEKPIVKELNYTPIKSFTEKAKKVFNSPQELQNDIKKTARAVGAKVNILDYLRTPDRVLEKIGLKKESDLIKQQYNKYLDELPVEIGKVTQWYNRVKKNEGAEKRIFQYLDGKGMPLEGEELKVANEMKTYLADWADKLGLPADNRIASYITHIFDKDFIKQEFDEDLAKIISEKLPGSVYDPFLQQRLGKRGYIEDVFKALDAYVKRAVRKVNMDPALEKLQSKEGTLDLDSWKYVKNYTDRINLRPTDLDNLLDNFIKSTPIGYKLGGRPTTAITRNFRQMVYRATLGLNVGSALRNLSQGANTYAKLGEIHTGVGYVKAIKSILMNDDELKRVGVLRDNMIQDRTISATKDTVEKLDAGLWALFNMAEKINRGAAYFGGKSKALSQGKSEQEAVKAGFDLARQTQFTFGSVDTPVALQGDIAKTALQFQSYSTKQAEFLGEMAKNKEYAGIARYIGASLAMTYTVGKLFGMKPTDMIPFYNQLETIATGENSEGRVPKSPLQTIGTGIASIPGVFSEDETTKTRSLDNIGKVGALTIPAGTQIRKTIRGLTDSFQGYNTSQSGRVRFPVGQDMATKVRAGLFGTYNLPESKEYFDNKMTPLGEKQSQRVKALGKDQYNKELGNRYKDEAISAFLQGDKEKARELQQKYSIKIKSSDIKKQATQQVMELYLSGQVDQARELKTKLKISISKGEAKKMAKDKAIELFLSGDREGARKLQQQFKFSIKKKDIYGE